MAKVQVAGFIVGPDLLSTDIITTLPFLHMYRDAHANRYSTHHIIATNYI